MPRKKKPAPDLAAPAERQQTTHVAFVLDKSGSMSHLRQDVVRVFNGLADGVHRNAQQHNQNTTVSLLTFSNNAHIVYLGADVASLRPMTLDDYRLDGMTALLDGVGVTVENLKRLPRADDPLTSFLVVVLTDGEENASRKYSPATLAQLLKETQQTDRWSFAFQVPKGTSYSGNYRANLAQRFGVPLDNIREWETTQQGLVETHVATQAGVGNYFAARAAGQKSVTKFYDVTTNLADVKTRDVKKSLDDISDRFKVFTVGPEQSVKEFVEQKTGKKYVIGSAFYQLMKPEKVQKSKAVLIMEKGKKAIWGGAEARELIGLPDDGDARVTPGNHSNYDIFIQSTSVNRKLPRGTKVLLDTTKTTDDKPTWDHTAVSASQTK